VPSAPVIARRATRTGLRGWLASLVPQLTGIGLTIINVSRADPRLMARTSYSDRTMETPIELIDLSRILLNLARSREFPYGSPRHGYDFIAPLDSEGTSIRFSGRSIGNTAGFGGFGQARRTRSAVSSTSLAAPSRSERPVLGDARRAL
jgi:hypothetical protein